MAHGGGHGSGGALKEFFLALGLDADSASFAAAESMVHGLELGLEKAFEVAEELADKFVETIEGTVEWAESLEHASIILGQSTDELQKLDYIAKISNVSNEELRMGFVHLARSMAEARDGSAETAQAFARLHTRVTDGHGKLRDQAEVLEDVAEGIRKLPTQADRSAIAMQVFGRAGAQLLPLLMKGKEGFAELREEAEKLGLILDEESVKRAAETAESLKKLGAIADSLQREFAGPFIEALQPILETVLEWVKANRQLISAKVREWAFKIADALQSLGGWLMRIEHTVNSNGEAWDLLSGSLKVIAGLIEGIGFVIEGVVILFEKLGDVAKTAAVIAFGAWLISLGPVALFGIGVGLALLAVQDFVYFLEGKDSLIGRIFQGWAREAMAFGRALRSALPEWVWVGLENRAGRQIDFGSSALGLKKEKIPASIAGALQTAAQSVPGGEFLLNRFFEGPGGTTTPATGRGNVNAPIINHITVTVPPGSAPQEIADRTVERIAEFHNARLREAITQVR